MINKVSNNSTSHQSCLHPSSKPIPVAHRSYGFTLIELLVVISIVSLLVAILIPALQSAQKASQATACMSNLRQVGVTLYNYASDFDDYFPYVGTADTNNQRNWYGRIGLQGYVGGGKPMAARPSKLHWRVFSCPSEAGSLIGVDGIYQSGDAEEGTTYFDGFRRGSSYSINRSLSPGAGQAGLFTPRKGFSNAVFTPTLSGYAGTYTPGQIPIVMDINDAGLGWAPSWFESSMDRTAAFVNPDFYWTKQYLYAFRHLNETANVLYMDGHVEPRKGMIRTGEVVYTPLFAGN